MACLNTSGTWAFVATFLFTTFCGRWLNIVLELIDSVWVWHGALALLEYRVENTLLFFFFSRLLTILKFVVL